MGCYWYALVIGIYIVVLKLLMLQSWIIYISFVRTWLKSYKSVP
jgi:hypothetical protein